jgi:uncharacterized protein YqeY
MTIEEQIMTRMKNAMREKHEAELAVLRMVKSQAQIARSAPGFGGKTDDAFWQEVISRYVKQQTRARGEFEAAGDAGREQVEKLNFEIGYLSEFLPKKLGEDAVRALVKEAITTLGIENPKMAGKLVGHIMKTHRDQVDAAMVKRIAEEELA